MSSIFPRIETINDMLPHVQHKEYIGINKQSNDATVICYNISNGESFTTPMEKEARGIAFDSDGKILSRPLHKFFNLAERAEVQPAVLDWTQMVAGFDKMDGSMISAGFLNGQFFAKSKKSFKSDVAVAAEQFVAKNQKYYDFTKYCSMANLSPIFEFTSPSHRIVLRYDEENMTLLHVRDNFTGEYLMPVEKELLAAKFDIPVNKPLFGVGYDLPSLIKSLNTVQGIEGYVIQFANGEMVKIKTKWYMELHHAVTFVRQRDIARLVVEEKLDDYIAYLALNAPEADLTTIHHINDSIKAHIENLDKEVHDIANQFVGQPIKDVAIALKGHPQFFFVMNVVRGFKNDYLTYYSRNHLSDWPLDEVDLGALGVTTEDAG